MHANIGMIENARDRTPMIGRSLAHYRITAALGAGSPAVERC